MHGKGNVPEISLFRQSFHDENVVADLPFEFEIDIRIFAQGGLEVVERKLFKLLFARGRLTGFGSVCGKAGDEVLQFFCALFGFFILLFLLTGEKLTRLIPKIVIADIHIDLSEIHVADIRTDLVEKMAVMRNDDDGVFEIHQIVFQPAHRLDVEVIGRLVQKQHVGIAEERLRQKDAHLLLRIEIGHRGIMQIFGNLQSI